MEKKVSRVIGNIKMLLGNNMKDCGYKMFKEMIEGASDGIYVCDVKSYELLYANKRIFEILGNDNKTYSGRKCYEFLMGYDSPCEFCKIHKMNKKEFVEREFNKIHNIHLILRGKRINWNGIEAHIEYITEIGRASCRERV